MFIQGNLFNTLSAVINKGPIAGNDNDDDDYYVGYDDAYDDNNNNVYTGQPLQHTKCCYQQGPRSRQ